MLFNRSNLKPQLSRSFVLSTGSRLTNPPQIRKSGDLPLLRGISSSVSLWGLFYFTRSTANAELVVLHNPRQPIQPKGIAMTKYLQSAMFACCVFFAHSASASAYFQNNLVPKGIADVNLTIMRWGAPDKVDPAVKMDRIIGQVASDKFQNVTLIFEGVSADKRTRRLSINTGVHAFNDGRYSHCTLCGSSKKDGHGAGTNAKGADISGGCFFEIFLPTQPGLQCLRLVDVQAEDNSVNYFVKFNVSPTVMRNSFKIPMSKTARLHPAMFNIEEPQAGAGGVEVKPASPQTPAAAKPAAKPNDKAIIPALESIDLGL